MAGKRRSDVAVERDKFVATEKSVVENKSGAQIAEELGVSERQARRLASEGLRQIMSVAKPDIEGLFRTIIDGFNEVLDQLEHSIKTYRDQGKVVPSRVLLSKVATLRELSRACGFDGPKRTTQPFTPNVAPEDHTLWLEFKKATRDMHPAAIERVLEYARLGAPDFPKPVTPKFLQGEICNES